MPEDAPLRLTDHELLALLAMNPSPSSAATMELLRLAPFAENELLGNAGITTLLVRGLAEFRGAGNDQQIVPLGRAAIAAAVLSRAEAWLEITLATSGAEHVLFTAASPTAALLLGIHGFGIHDLQPVDPDAGMLALGITAGREYLQSGAEGLPASVTIRHHRLSREPLTARLTATAEGPWLLQTGSGATPTSEAVEATDAFARLEAALES